jgi:hypothetical protein
MPGQAQFQHPGVGGVLGRGPPGAGPECGEEFQLARPEVTDQRGEGGRGVTEPFGCGDGGQALGQVGAQCLITPLRRADRLEEELPAPPRGHLGGDR